jgi:hypothetical protein
MKMPLVLLFGSALIAAGVSTASAQEPQTTTTQNPFGGTAQKPFEGTARHITPSFKKPRAATALKAGQFVTETEAKASCPGDTVVWANTGSNIYHHAGAATYGKTKRGAYMCEKNTAAAGIRAAKNEKQY